MASQIPTVLQGTAKPILSSSFGEARRRALNLYKAWYREVGCLNYPALDGYIYIFLIFILLFFKSMVRFLERLRIISLIFQRNKADRS